MANTAATTSDTRAELIKEWAPNATVLKNFDALENEKKRLHDHCALQSTIVDEQAKPVKEEKKLLDGSAEDNFKENSRLLAEMVNEIEKLKILADEHNQLASQSPDLIKKLDSEQSALNDQELKLKECEDQIKDDDERQKRLEQDAAELQQRLDELKRKENENIDEQNHLQLSMNGLQELIARTQQELKQQQQHLAVEEVELKETKCRIQVLKDQLEKMETKMKNIQKELERLQDEQLQLTAKQNDLKKQQEQLQTIIKQLQDVLKQKEDSLVRMHLETEKYKEKIEVLKKQLQKISEEIQKLTIKLNDEEKSMKETEEKLSNIESERKSLESVKQDLVKQKQVLDDKLVDYENQMDILRLKLTTTENLLREAQSSTRADEAKLHQLRSELAELEKQTEKVESDLTQMAIQCDNLQHSREEASKDLQQVENEKREADQKLKQLKQQLCELKRQQEQAKSEEQMALRQMNNAEQEMKAAEQEVHLKEQALLAKEAVLAGCTIFNLFWVFPIGKAAQTAQTAVVTKAQQELNDAKSRLESKKSAHKECDEKYLAAKNKTANVSIQRNDKVTEHDNQEQFLSTKTTELTQSKHKLDDLKLEYLSALTKKSELQNNANRIQKKITATRSNINTSDAELQKHKAESTTYDNRKNEIVLSVTTMATEITRQKRLIIEHEKLMSQHQVQLNTNDIEHQKTVKEIEVAKRNVHSVKQALSEKGNDGKAKTREIASEETLLESQEQSVSKLKEQIQSQEGKLDAVKQQARTNKSELDIITDKLQQLQQDKVRTEQNRVTCGEEIEKKEKVYQETRIRVQQLTSQIQKLQQKLAVLDERDDQLMNQIYNAEKELKNRKQVAEENRKHLNKTKEKGTNIQSARLLAEKCFTETKVIVEDVKSTLEQNASNFTRSEQRFRKLNTEIHQSNEKLGNNENKREEALRKLQEYEKTITNITIHYHQTNSQLEKLSYEMIDKDLKQRPDHKWNRAQRNAVANQQHNVVTAQQQQKQYK